MKKRIISLMALSVMVLCGCGENNTQKDSSSTNDTTSGTTNNTTSSTVNDNGQTTSSDGKIYTNDNTEVKSKTVNCYMPSPGGLQAKIEKGFEAKYPGIDLVLTSGTTGELEAKIEAEKNNPICDVLILASWSDGISVLDTYNLLSYSPKDGEKLNAAFKEDSKKIWGTSASAVGVIYNTDTVQKSFIETLDWKDYGDSKKINSTDYTFSIPDPTKSGACKDFLAGLVCSYGETEGNEILTSWVNNGIVNGGGNKPALQAVENGSVDILVGGVDYNAYVDKKVEKHIDIYYPKSGTVVNPRPAMIMADGAHNDAAKLVMDYLVSEEAQEFVASEYLLPGRVDVNADSSRTNISEINQFDNLNWITMAAKGTEIASKFVNDIKSR